MSTTQKKDKIFNVRKVAYKQFDNKKYLKQNFSPCYLKENNLQNNHSNLIQTNNEMD